jgi:hypothetical protein
LVLAFFVVLGLHAAAFAGDSGSGGFDGRFALTSNGGGGFDGPATPGGGGFDVQISATTIDVAALRDKGDIKAQRDNDSGQQKLQQ